MIKSWNVYIVFHKMADTTDIPMQLHLLYFLIVSYELCVNMVTNIPFTLHVVITDHDFSSSWGITKPICYWEVVLLPIQLVTGIYIQCTHTQIKASWVFHYEPVNHILFTCVPSYWMWFKLYNYVGLYFLQHRHRKCTCIYMY